VAKAPAKKDEAKADAATEGEEQAPKKKGKLPLIVALVVVLAGGGGGAWFFLFKNKGEEAPQEAKAQPAKPPVFVPIENFTVNLTPDGSEQYLQVSATLKVLDAHAGDAVKQYMPEVRHRILLLLSAKKASQINTVEGRERLSEEIRVTTNNILLVAAGKPPKAAPGKAESAGAPAPAPAAEAKPEEGDAAKAQEEGAKPAAEAAAVPAPAAAPAAAPAQAIAKAAPDDPVQSVFFTSFIIQ
jgi:flagellar FliL protein